MCGDLAEIAGRFRNCAIPRPDTVRKIAITPCKLQRLVGDFAHPKPAKPEPNRVLQFVAACSLITARNASP